MLGALRERYSFPEWIFLTEVPDGTGAMGSRRADGFAFNLFPSKGFTKICFEIKASVSDLKRELEDGTKSNAVGQYANLFFLVCPENLWKSESILLPETWGILEFNESTGKLRQKKKPVPYTPRPLDDVFAASLLQSMHRCFCTNDDELKRSLYWQERRIRSECEAKYRKELETQREHIRQDLEMEYNLDKRLLENIEKAYGRGSLRFNSIDFQQDFREFKNFLYSRARMKSAIDSLQQETKELQEKVQTLFINEKASDFDD